MHFIAAGFLSGGVGAAVNGGNILKGAVTGAFSAAAFNWAGHVNHGIRPIQAHFVAGAVSSGFSASVYGGSMGRAALTGGISGALGKSVTLNNRFKHVSPGNFHAGQFAATMAAGGIGSYISGGSFGDGAAVSGMGYVYNHLFHSDPMQGLFDKHGINIVRVDGGVDYPDFSGLSYEQKKAFAQDLALLVKKDSGLPDYGSVQAIAGGALLGAAAGGYGSGIGTALGFAAFQYNYRCGNIYDAFKQTFSLHGLNYFGSWSGRVPEHGRMEISPGYSRYHVTPVIRVGEYRFKVDPWYTGNWSLKDY
jgi:hypothetical protein